MELETLMVTVQEKIGALIQRPKMTEKLLSKPPFRFLHDTISAIITTTGFGEGLYSDQEKDSASITEKPAKLSYLDKIFNLVGICQGIALDVKSVKVVAGLEPEFTNMFLIALAECASNDQIDNDQAIRRCLNGELPGSGSLPLRSHNSKPLVAESKTEIDSNVTKASAKSSPRSIAPVVASSTPRESKSNESKHQQDTHSSSSSSSSAMDGGVVGTSSGARGVSRGGTRGGKPNMATPDIALSGLSSVPIPSNLDAMVEKCDGTEELTQTMLGELITRPKLTTKLLSKPPFRFLFDIVLEVIQVTGFGNGLYSDSEKDSANIKEKQQKMDFLEKIIKLVGIQLNTLVEARPAKIVAGLDPQATNNFLQLLSIAAKNMPQSDNAVKMVLSNMPRAEGTEITSSRSSAVSNSAGMDEKPSYTTTTANVRTKSGESTTTLASEPKRASNNSINESKPSNNTTTTALTTTTESLMSNNKMNNINTISADDKDNNSSSNDNDNNEMKRSARPSTAGRRPPRVKENVITAPESAPVTAVAEVKAAGILLDGQNDDDDDDIVDETRLADDINRRMADGKDYINGNNTSSSSSTVAAESKLVKDILSRQAEQAALQDSKAISGDEKESGCNNNTTSTTAGGIRLMRNNQQQRKPDNNTNNNNNRSIAGSGIGMNGGSGASGGGVNMSEADMDRLRVSIQSLVQQTGPLGTCMDFIQDDVETMSSELRKWEEESKRYESQLNDEGKKSKDLLRPLELELVDLKEQVYEKSARISSLKGVILRNEERLYEVYKTGAVL